MNPLRKPAASASVDTLTARLAKFDEDKATARKEYDAIALAEADGAADPAAVEQAHRALAAATQVRERTATALAAAKAREADAARARERESLAASWAAAAEIVERRATLAATLQAKIVEAAATYRAMADETAKLCRALPATGPHVGAHGQHALVTGAYLLSEYLAAELHRAGLVPDPALAGAVVPPLREKYRSAPALERLRGESLDAFDMKAGGHD